jgi:hypothetical protein
MKKFLCINDGLIIINDLWYTAPEGIRKGEVYTSDGIIMFDEDNVKVIYIDDINKECLIVRFVELADLTIDTIIEEKVLETV